MKDVLNSILIVDDDVSVLKLYKQLLSDELHAKIVTSKHPSYAHELAMQHFYDVCLIDINMQFHGDAFGGIALYKLLSKRYGADSLLAYSQCIKDDLLERYQCSFNFIENSDDTLQNIKDLSRKAIELRKKQKCFVAIPFDDKYSYLYDIIEKAIKESNYIPIRLNNQIFTASIVKKIFEEIECSKVVVFVATDKNPNTFYECGYAVCLRKEVITIIDSYHDLPFDIRDRNAIEYGNAIESLEAPLKDHLSNLTKIL